MEIEEIKEAVKGKPELLDGIISYANATDKGLAVLSNFAKADFDKNIGTKVGELYSNIDKDIKEVLGDEKPTTMKTFDHIKKLATELKGLRNGGGDKALKAKVAELEGKLADGKEKHWHDMFTKGTETWTAKEKEHIATIEGLKSEMSTTIVKSEIAKGIVGIKLNSGIPKQAQEMILNNAITQLSSTAKVVDGKVILQKQGAAGLETWQDTDTYQPISASKALNELLKESLEVKNPTGGKADKGTKFGNLVTIGEGDKAKKHVALDKSKVTTKQSFLDEFEKTMIEKGIGRGTREWLELEAETMKTMGVADLPTK